MPPPGQYRTRLTIQSPTTTNTDGITAQTWALAVKRWGRVLEVPGREFVQDDGLHTRRVFEVRMRFYSGLTQGQRIICKISGTSRTLLLTGPPTTDDSTHYRETVCMCAQTDAT